MEALLATILVLVVTDHNIVLAADSKKTSLGSEGVVKNETMDKIYRVHDYFYAIAGLDSSGDGSFSVHAILNRILQQYSDLEQVIQEILAQLPYALKDFFSGLKARSPEVFGQYQKYSASGGEIVIIKRVGKIPTLYLLDYRIIDESTMKIVMNTWKADTSTMKEKAQCFWRAIGSTSFLSGRHPSDEEMSLHAKEKAREIIEEGIRVYPDFVGGPVKIVSMEMEGESGMVEY
ncbi:hypothetical protein OCK74_22855 [Chitinophagaceae bacterium LB-8]|uniref:Uncharacterized protein n=1 Tax=Paraflavisolibacter caeni TaxID=2982496 RepID=A0A9X3BK13_9BACT|nr:hypothetical protein [Paraflavisolibacter caeni]MCU7551978.1 hypothetical protein [Paraflavisolibacter caeni]